MTREELLQILARYDGNKDSRGDFQKSVQRLREKMLGKKSIQNQQGGK